MIGLTQWIDILRHFGSEHNKVKLRQKIISECLDVPQKMFGSWIVNLSDIFE